MRTSQKSQASAAGSRLKVAAGASLPPRASEAPAGCPARACEAPGSSCPWRGQPALAAAAARAPGGRRAADRRGAPRRRSQLGVAWGVLAKIRSHFLLLCRDRAFDLQKMTTNYHG